MAEPCMLDGEYKDTEKNLELLLKKYWTKLKKDKLRTRNTEITRNSLLVIYGLLAKMSVTQEPMHRKHRPPALNAVKWFILNISLLVMLL
jgi:hypothetical protein